MKPILTILALLLIAIACRSSSSEPDYTTKLVPVTDERFIVQVESRTSMSEESLRRALLREAARATIDHGALFLRVENVIASTKINAEPSATGNAYPYPAPASSQPSGKSEVSFSRSRNGSITFTVHRERPQGDKVFDASQLLDRLQRGELPPV